MDSVQYYEVLAREFWVCSLRLHGRDVPLRLSTAFYYIEGLADPKVPGVPVLLQRRAVALKEKMPVRAA